MTTAPYVYTALGDSLTFGTGADERQGFAYLVYRQLQEARRANIAFHLHGTVGATTKELLEKVQADHSLRERLRLADLITLTAGGNDIIQAAKKMYMEGVLTSMKPPMRAFEQSYRELLEELVALNRPKERGCQIIVVDVYNPLPMFDDAVLWIRFLNRCIQRCAAAYEPYVRVARVYPKFVDREEEYISDDGFHPNGDGHAALAECVKQELRLLAGSGGA
ncbi:SGNH/GDSL hydrolase family protein [Paenibacillus thermotolerans]|uniref:SGNH/GDSL hydrolase family protein n=1 Tax=Paenibacillus thermotolerans TaxID=3027807 RepID=UPI002367AB9A|nr:MULTISPECIES: SGNH/GDSL hydrolase family protein [unclassified Paenibacillus]